MQKHWVTHAISCLDDCQSSAKHELNELDWKVGISEKNERLIEHLIAFSNYPNGGFIVFGIKNDCEIMGVNQADVGNIVSKLTNLGREGIEPPLLLDHHVHTIEEKNILLVHVAEAIAKPAHRRGKSIEESWIRSGSTTRKASRQEIGNLMLHSKTPTWEGLRASPLLSSTEIFDQIDISAIAHLLNHPLPSDDEQILTWAAEEGLIVRDQSGFYITNLGAIAGAKRLDKFDPLKRKCIRVVRYKGTNKVETIDETIGQKGYAVGYEKLLNFLGKILPHSEVIKQALRVDTTLYPEIALRELIANALIHQDFSVNGTGPMIEIFDDRITFTNPGGLLPGKSIDRLIGTTPISRNEQLASAFRRYRICEERGTGFQKVVASAELFGMPPISFNQLEDAFRVTLYAPKEFSKMSAQERIEACYQHAMLQFLSSDTLTNTSLRKRFKISDEKRNSVTNIISEAVDAGRIKRKDTGGGSKFAEYLPYWA